MPLVTSIGSGGANQWGQFQKAGGNYWYRSTTSADLWYSDYLAFSDIFIDTQNRVIIAGANFESYDTGRDGLLIKASAEGQDLWKRSLTRPYSPLLSSTINADRLYSCAASQNSIYTLGTSTTDVARLYYNNTTVASNGVVWKTSTSGQHQWQRIIINPPHNPNYWASDGGTRFYMSGSTYYQARTYAYDCAFDVDGNLYTAGFFDTKSWQSVPQTTTDPTYRTFYGVVKQDVEGNLIWATEVSSISTTNISVSGNYVLVFGVDTPHKITCINATTGSVVWSKAISTQYGIYSFANVRLATNSTSVFVARLTSYVTYVNGLQTYIPVWVLHKFDLDGTLLWTKAYREIFAETGYQYNVTICADASKVYLASNWGSVATISASNGNIISQTKITESGLDLVSISNDTTQSSSSPVYNRYTLENCMSMTTYGGYLFIARRQLADSNKVQVIKIDPTSNEVLWQTTLQCDELNNWSGSWMIRVVAHQDGVFLLKTMAYQWSRLLVRLDANGQLLWHRAITLSDTGGAVGLSVSNNTVAMAGGNPFKNVVLPLDYPSEFPGEYETFPVYKGEYDYSSILIRKATEVFSSASTYLVIDSNGNWQNHTGTVSDLIYDDSFQSSLQNTTLKSSRLKTLDLVDVFASAVDANENVIGLCLSNRSKKFETYLIKIGPSGSLLWQRKLSFAANVVVTLSNGSIICAGALTDNSGIVIQRVSATGTSVWAKKVVLTSGVDAYVVNALAVDANGDFYVGGLYEIGISNPDSHSFLFKFSSNGTLQWSRSLGNQNAGFHDITIGPDNVPVLSGKALFTLTYQWNGETYQYDSYDHILVKYFGDGTIKWQRRLGLPSWSPIKVATDSENDIYFITDFSHMNQQTYETTYYQVLARIPGDGSLTGFYEDVPGFYIDYQPSELTHVARSWDIINFTASLTPSADLTIAFGEYETANSTCVSANPIYL